MNLGDRMKRYEHTYRRTLPRRTYTLIRVDGRAFSTMSKLHFTRPFSQLFVKQMNAVAYTMAKEIVGVEFAYVQSDEVSLLLTDFAKYETEPWMGGVESKVLSLSAATATRAWCDGAGIPLGEFDSRVWTMSDPAEVCNYFIWRQRDAIKNSVSMYAGHYFSHGELDGKNTDERVKMLAQRGHRWEQLDRGITHGRFVNMRQAKWWVDPAHDFSYESLRGLVPDIGS